MTIERLETIAANLYKEAEEATPIIGGADKLDWMARRLDDIIENNEPGLNDYLNCETSDQVEALLETEYNDFQDRDDNDDEEDDLPEDEEVALTGTPSDLNEDAIIREERLSEPAPTTDRLADVRDDRDDINKRPEKETGIKDELPDAYVDKRPDQPEYIDNEPNYFEDQPAIIIEEEIIFVDDPSQGTYIKDSDLPDPGSKCGESKA